MTPLPRLYGIADASFGDPYKLASDLFEGGVRFLQVRDKNASSRDLLEEVERILAIAPVGAQVIVNDRADVARLARAAGVHVGQTDLPVAAVREVVGTDSIVGISTHNLVQAIQADKLPVDYIAVGPVFPTSTKANAETVIGLDMLTAICREIHKPVFAIGGIQLNDAGKVFEAGVHGVAVISDLLHHADVAARTRAWINFLGSLNAG